MMKRFRRLGRDQRGFSFVFVGVSFMAFMSASTLAIDLGMLMTARAQAQNSADAGALAGATALVFNSFTDRTASGPAVSGAISAAQKNAVASQAPSVTPDDVTFPLDTATGEYDIVEVSVYRTTARLNPVGTLIGRIFGTDVADVWATARATAYPANELSCVLPWTVPDKWIEKQDPSWSPSSSFNIAETQGNHSNAGAPLANPDIYIPPGQPNPTGYSPATDVGVQLVLKPSAQNAVTPSMYNAWNIGGITGADEYGENIGTCNSTPVKKGLFMTPETGNMVGPTKDGTQELIDSDPDAVWDTACNKGKGCVRNSDFGTSPRIRAIPLYDPAVYAADQHSGKSQPSLQVVNYLGFFIESVDGGGAVRGRITPITGKFSKSAPSATGGFARAIMLVK
ncbi:MAG TPA: pilus assembly protein TadG-related protein [Vicinamibacterales bacterium]|nr:pilus assembly protein TadG-related protein [Vicinamibacterales bacterium]